MSGPKDTLAIGTTDAADSAIQSTGVKADFGRYATLTNPGIMPTDPRQIVPILTTLLEDAERYRQPYEEEWLRLYSQYHGGTATDGKAPWQSKVHVALSKRDVDTIASKIVSIIFSEEDWFDIQPNSRGQDPLRDIAMKTIQWQIHRGRFREPLETSLKDALICGTGPLKVTYERVLRPQMSSQFVAPPPIMGPGNQMIVGKGKFQMKRTMAPVAGLRMAPVMPTDWWLDPSGQNRFVIQRSKRHLSDLWKLTKPQIDPATGEEILPAIYDADEVGKIRPGSRDRKLDQFASVIRRERYMAYQDMSVDLYEIWGDIPDPSTGVVLWQNCFATFVDKQWLLRPPQENPWWHQRIPFIDFRSMLNPHQLYGYGFLMQGSSLQEEIDRVLQLMVDKLHLSVPMMERDPAAMKNSEDAGGSHMKVDPGRIWDRKHADRPIFTQVKMTEGPTQADANLYQILNSAHEITTSVNEWSTGQNQSTTRKTKAEAEIKASASQTQFNDIGQYVEEHSLSPFVQMVWELTIQFETQLSAPKLLEMLSDNQPAAQMLMAFANMPPEERWAKMGLDAEFRVDGVTRQVTRQQRLDRLFNFLKLIQGDPSGIMPKLVDNRFIMQEAIVDLQLPRNVVIGEADAVMQAAEQSLLAMLQQQIMGAAQGQPPGQPPQNGGPPGQNPHNQAQGAQAAPPQQQGQPQ